MKDLGKNRKGAARKTSPENPGGTEDDISLLPLMQQLPQWIADDTTTEPIGFDLNSLSLGLSKKQKLFDNEIKAITRNLLGKLLRNKEQSTNGTENIDLISLLNPASILRLLGCEVRSEISLGDYDKEGNQINIGALLDIKNKVVVFSEQMRPSQRRFTLAHELGHYVMHYYRFRNVALHRDLPINGSKIYRTQPEWEADRFGTHLLMPEKLVRTVFRGYFHTDRFKINEDTAFSLNKGSVTHLRDRFKNIDEFARFMASIRFYKRRVFPSMAETFMVSEQTMAIRLKELKLLEF
ncbi:MAG: ImmA/IrrE family metallo-endopeptidase [Bacteroidota bacterium]